MHDFVSKHTQVEYHFNILTNKPQKIVVKVWMTTPHSFCHSRVSNKSTSKLKTSDLTEKFPSTAYSGAHINTA